MLATGDGCTAHTSIPLLCTSMCSEHASWETNALVAAYDAANGVGMNPATDEVKTMHPFCLLVTILWRKWWAIAKLAVALHSTLAAGRGHDRENEM